METLPDIDKIEDVLSHIQNVQRNCYKLGLKLIKHGEVEFGRKLIANGQVHDNSKFTGFEFRHLFYDSPLLQEAIINHSSTNEHHPECWGGIQHMPQIYLAEMVCDCAARSAEFGSDIRKWFAEVATGKYKFEMDDAVGKNITRFLDLLLSAAFK